MQQICDDLVAEHLELDRLTGGDAEDGRDRVVPAEVRVMTVDGVGRHDRP